MGCDTEPAGVYEADALSLNAKAFRLPVDPNSLHFFSTSDQTNSLFPYATMFPDFGVTVSSPIVIGDTVEPSVISVVVTPRYDVGLLRSDIRSRASWSLKLYVFPLGYVILEISAIIILLISCKNHVFIVFRVNKTPDFFIPKIPFSFRNMN